MSKRSEYHTRKILKTITWRIIATSTTMVLVFIFTGEWVLAVEVGILEVISKMLFYYGHEYVWDKISYGKSSHPLNTLILKKDMEPEDRKEIEKRLEELGYL